MQVKGRWYYMVGAVLAVLVASLTLGIGDEERVYAVGNARADSNLERLRSVLSRLIDPILPLFLEEHTTYASGFTEEAFRSLKAGQSEQDVRRALGAPLSERLLADGRKILYYSEQATPTANYYMRLVVLDAQGRLVERHSQFYLD